MSEDRPHGGSAGYRWIEGIAINLVSSAIAFSIGWLVARTGGVVEGYGVITLLAGIVLVTGLLALAIFLWALTRSEIPSTFSYYDVDEELDALDSGTTLEEQRDKANRSVKLLATGLVALALVIAVAIVVWLT